VNHEDDLARRGEARLAEHARECDECAAAPLAFETIARSLAAYAVPLDVAELSRRVARHLQPELARLASVWFWRRLGRVIFAALLPLPLILLLDAYVLGVFYAWASTVLPAALATYLVISYAASQLLLFAATYAAIPLLLARDAWFRGLTTAEALP